MPRTRTAAFCGTGAPEVDGYSKIDEAHFGMGAPSSAGGPSYFQMWDTKVVPYQRNSVTVTGLDTLKVNP